MRFTNDFKDYELLDCGDLEKLERWGDFTLLRPDPTCIWEKQNPHLRADAHYQEKWHYSKTIPDYWTIDYKDLTFKVSPTHFKHTGLFPEQAVNWDWLSKLIKDAKQPIRVLNLFAYTGGATLAASKAGATEVVHVDSSKKMVEWAKENAALSGLEHHKIRYLVDDVVKFVQREKRRNRTYHGIIMDPPSYGHGPKGERWKIEEQIIPLLNDCLSILDEEPLFFLLNSYTTGFSAQIIENLLHSTMMKKLNKGVIDAQEIGIPLKDSSLILPCGVSGRWANDADSL